MRLSRLLLVGLLLGLASPAMAQSGCGGQSAAYSWCGNAGATQALPGFTTNPIANNFISRTTNVVSGGTTTILTKTSTRTQNLTGSSTQTFQLPDATTLTIGSSFQFNNNSTGLLTVTNNGTSTVTTVPAGGVGVVIAIAVSTSNGAWDFHFWAPSNVQWGTTGLQISGTSSGTGTFAVPAAAGTGTLFQIPGGNGTNGQILTTDGSGHLSWSTVGGTGTVTSVGLSLPGIFTVTGSPVTTTGTLTGTLANQSANLVWAGPNTGAAAAPTFRSLVGADLPNPSATTLGGIESLAAVSSKWINTISTSGVPSATQPAFTDISGTATTGQIPTATAILDTIDNTQGDILYRGASSWTFLPTGTVGQVLTAGGAGANPAWATTSGTGTVTSVSTGTGLTGGPITTSGTISLAAIASGSLLANLAVGTNPPVATTPTAVLDTFSTTQGSVLYRAGGAWAALAPGTNGQVLTSAGAGANPSWTAVTAGIIDAGGATTITNGKSRDFLTQSNSAAVAHTGLPYMAFATVSGAL